MRSAIIGNGFIAGKHRVAIEKMGWGYVGAYDIVPSRSEISLKDVEKADIVHICTPTAFHIPYLKQFKHKKVIVEKPISTNLSVPDIDACVCYQRRFDSQALEMKKRCVAPPDRMIVNILVPRDNHYWESWRGEKDISGGGALMNIGVHFIDLLQWWFGDGEVIESKIGYFYRVIDESVSARLRFGPTLVDFNLSARHNDRKTEMIAFWGKDHFIYDTEDATHYELFYGWTKGVYVSPKEAVKSLELTLDIYGNDTQKIQE